MQTARSPLSPFDPGGYRACNHASPASACSPTKPPPTGFLKPVLQRPFSRLLARRNRTVPRRLIQQCICAGFRSGMHVPVSGVGHRIAGFTEPCTVPAYLPAHRKSGTKDQAQDDPANSTAPVQIGFSGTRAASAAQALDSGHLERNCVPKMYRFSLKSRISECPSHTCAPGLTRSGRVQELRSNRNGYNRTESLKFGATAKC